MITHLVILIAIQAVFMVLALLAPAKAFEKKTDRQSQAIGEMWFKIPLRFFQGYIVWVFWNLLAPSYAQMPDLPYWHALGFVYLLGALTFRTGKST